MNDTSEKPEAWPDTRLLPFYPAFQEETNDERR